MPRRSTAHLTDHARALRSQATDAEIMLWRRLRARRLGVRVRRQHPVADYILDFYCPEAKLAIELDGGGHTDPDQRAYDQRRTRNLERLGIRVLRLWNPDVVRTPDAALELIAACIRGAAVPPPRPRIDTFST